MLIRSRCDKTLSRRGISGANKGKVKLIFLGHPSKLVKNCVDYIKNYQRAAIIASFGLDNNKNSSANYDFNLNSSSPIDFLN
jgi:hypothetical protein